MLAFASAMVWLVGPLLSWNNHAPFASAEKRGYLILFIFLSWVLKHLILDANEDDRFQTNDQPSRIKLDALLNRFRGALKFLKKTTVYRFGKTLRLKKLPWFLLIGPSGAGKSSLLANAKVNFILQRQFQAQDTKHLEPSDTCDWWITQEASIVDVPGKYLASQSSKNKKPSIYALLWQYFLYLLRKERGKNGISGIIIALPLPELMEEEETERYQAMLHLLFQNIVELQKTFPQPIPYTLVITKCDLLTGFNEFFMECSQDEMSQAWGVSLPAPQNGEQAYDIFTTQFNALIKKLNQQLLWRLHQERNPMARPYIKDFPLQVERLKEFTATFFKKLADAHLNIHVQSVYLTSALQDKVGAESKTIVDPVNPTHQAVKVFKESVTPSRAYFINQFLTTALPSLHEEVAQGSLSPIWKRRVAYATSFGIAWIAAIMLGRDFVQGARQAYTLQNRLSDYQIAILNSHDPDDHLVRSLKLLDNLQRSAKQISYKIDFTHLLKFYSHNTQQKSVLIYNQALQTIFIPQVHYYLAEYLKNPVNKNTEYVYAALKAYIMMGDPDHFQPNYIETTMRQILPKSLDSTISDELMKHLDTALNTMQNPLPLDQDLLQDTRKYLTSLPNFQLGYIILKNIGNNNIISEINLGTNQPNVPVFMSQQVMNQIPTMFTVQAFPTILQQEATMAAQEATVGNWVLGNDISTVRNPQLATPLMDQLRTMYVNNYVDVWESLLANIQLNASKDLAQTDVMVLNLVSNDSPLLQLLQTFHDNTYFEPIASSSPKLQSLGLLIDKTSQAQADNLLYRIIGGLQSLHQYLQIILSADNERKAAFKAVSERTLNAGSSSDAITQLRLIAEKSPEPIKNWLDKIADDAWRYLLHDASLYLDTAWQENVSQIYQSDIAERYPFKLDSEKEVALKNFSNFFGNPGVLMSFYSQYLQPFIDTTESDWHWKVIDKQKLPFTDDTLRQLQLALRINATFFPQGNNKVKLQFALQPFKIGKQFRTVQFSMDDSQFTDGSTNGLKDPHIITWPSNSASKMTSMYLMMNHDRGIHRQFPGDWGWFKFVNQTFESPVTKKALLLNLSNNIYPAKYLLYTETQTNPFLSLDLEHFHLPQQLMG